MAAITRAHHTGLTVRNLERSIAFYCDLLGFEVVFRWNPKAPYIGELVGYPSVDLHAAILSIPNSAVFLELLEYRGIPEAAVDMANGNIGNAHIAFSSTNSTRYTSAWLRKEWQASRSRSRRPSARTAVAGPFT